MQRSFALSSMLALGLAVSDCNCDDKLASSVGELSLELCDRGNACGCESLEPKSSFIGFGSPEVGSTARRIVTVINDNQPRQLVIESLSINDPSESFVISGIARRSSSRRALHPAYQSARSCGNR